MATAGIAVAVDHNNGRNESLEEEVDIGQFFKEQEAREAEQRRQFREYKSLRSSIKDAGEDTNGSVRGGMEAEHGRTSDN